MRFTPHTHIPSHPGATRRRHVPPPCTRLCLFAPIQRQAMPHIPPPFLLRCPPSISPPQPSAGSTHSSPPAAPLLRGPPSPPNRLFPCVFPPRLFFAAHTGGPAPPEPWPTLQAPFISLLTPFVQPPPSLPPLPQPSGPAPRAPQPPVALAPRRPSCTQLPRALPTQRLPPHHLSCPQTPIWPHFIWSHPLCYLLFDRVDCRRRAR